MVNSRLKSLGTNTQRLPGIVAHRPPSQILRLDTSAENSTINRNFQTTHVSPHRSNERIGLLGGSFDPAHDGHRTLSLAALKHLGLTKIWWLVSPQNPLKSRASMGFDERLKYAASVANHAKIEVRSIEARLGTTQTVATIGRLQQMFAARFVFLIGADNLHQLHRWYRWRALIRACPIAVFARNPYSTTVFGSRAARLLERARVPVASAHGLAMMAPPAWTFIPMRPHPASSTAIRAKGRGKSQSEE